MLRYSFTCAQKASRFFQSERVSGATPSFFGQFPVGLRVAQTFGQGYPSGEPRELLQVDNLAGVCVSPCEVGGLLAWHNLS